MLFPGSVFPAPALLQAGEEGTVFLLSALLPRAPPISFFSGNCVCFSGFETRSRLAEQMEVTE